MMNNSRTEQTWRFIRSESTQIKFTLPQHTFETGTVFHDDDLTEVVEDKNKETNYPNEEPDTFAGYKRPALGTSNTCRAQCFGSVIAFCRLSIVAVQCV